MTIGYLSAQQMSSIIFQCGVFSISHRVRLSLIACSSTSQKKWLQIPCIFLSFKGNIIWTSSIGPVTPPSVAFISFAKKVAIDFCQIFSQLLGILFSL